MRSKSSANAKFTVPPAILLGAGALLAASTFFADPAHAADLKVMKAGLGDGTITSTPTGIDCGRDCAETYGSDVSVTLKAAAPAGSRFSRWLGDCSGTATDTCTVQMAEDRSVRAEFDLDPPIPKLGGFTPKAIDDFLFKNPIVNTPARFVRALPLEYRKNWILMTRSESVQTGTAKYPRLLLPSAKAEYVFTIGLAEHASYPGSHPNAIEFMQWDGTEKNGASPTGMPTTAGAE